MSLLQTHELSIGYSADKPLQSEVNFRLGSGQVMLLMGQNGVGKTTFIKTIHGLLPSLEGHVEMSGRHVNEFSRQELAQKFSVVLTEKPPVGNLSVRDLIGLGRHPYNNWLGILSKEDKGAVEHAIDITKINYIADRQIHELSDGQFQKAMIARALAQDTDIIVLDEPVAHLDLNNKIEVLLLLRQIADQGKGILISTHDTQITTQLADELWLFNFNKPAQNGLPEDLIVSGILSEALYLEHHSYDMVHHRLLLNADGVTVSLTGDDATIYWTSQALTRAGFQIGESQIKVQCEPKKWTLADQTFSSISRLIASLSSEIHRRSGT